MVIETIDGVREAVEHLVRIADRPEVARALEHDIHAHVLRLVAEGHPDASALARAALATQLVGFPRWGAA